jgi:LPXTG-site transpeptidase (sortase) family protein
MTPRKFLRMVAVALVLTGLFLMGKFAYTVWHEQGSDATATRQWKDLVEAAKGPAAGPDPSPAASADPAAPLPGGIYLKLTVEKLNKDGIAVDGDWNNLKTASMVHYRSSPAPGTKGNMLIAFHRETHWYDIDQLQKGDTVLIETIDRKVYKYQVDFMKIVLPSDVSLLRPTDGTDLTMITCDPIWQDYNRMVFRAHLVTA